MTFLRVMAAAAIGCAVPLAAQQVPVQQRSVSGRVVRPAAEGNLPVPGVWVTLHRVGPDAAGPLDSMRTSTDGGYRFTYRRSGSEEATYFVTAFHDGIAYFATPLMSADVRGEDAEITVFDTSAAPVAVRARGRHIAVAAPSEGRRTVIEIYELSNDTIVTRVAGTPERPTYVALFPEKARDVRVGEGDVAADAARIEKGRLLVFAPIAPGLKQLSFSYTLGADDFPLSIPVTDSTDVFEVLLEQGGGSATGAGLRDLGDVTLDGRRFRRFLAQDVAARSVIRIDVPDAPAPKTWGWYVTILAALLALAMLGAFARAMMKPARAPQAAAPLRESDRVAREIAALDARTAEHGATPETVREREALQARLIRALAAESGTG